MRGRAHEQADEVTGERDPRMMRRRDALELGLVVRHDRALQLERGRELTRLDAQGRAQGAEARRADARAAGKRGRVLMPLAAVCVADEGDRDRRGECRREQEEQDGVPDDRQPVGPFLV